MLSVTTSLAQTIDKQYTVTLTWSQWLKIGALLDQAPVGQYNSIYNEIQRQFGDQNIRENKAAEDRLRKRLTEENVPAIVPN